MVGGSGFRLGALLACVLGFSFALPQEGPVVSDEITLVYEPAWQTEVGDVFGTMVPLRVEIDNPLNNDQGVVTVKSGSYRMLYPVEMPAKSRRSFIVYVPHMISFGEQTIELACRQGYMRLVLSMGSSYGESLDFGLISDTLALMRFVRATKIEDEDSTDEYRQTIVQRDFAAKPGSAPDRTIGYEGLELLVLGEGAERMTDAEVGAVQRYVLGGGTLLMTGGAVSPILRDERWRAYLPGTDPRVVNVQGSRVLSTVSGVPLTGTLTLTQLTPAPGTTGLMENGIPMLWYRRCGLGMVVYWAFDPFVAPVRNWAGRSKLFSDTALATGSEANSYLVELGVLQQPMDEYGYSYYDPSYSEDSVFQVSMPSTSKLFVILGLYFVVVVPLNFIVLNRMKRGQLAWLTSPMIGLVFASIFFYVARDLYSTNLSRATTAVVLAHEGSPTAYALGKQELFFPNGGRYDLGLTSVESVTSSTTQYDYYGMQADTGFFGDLFDTGEIVAPRAGVSNLSFREYMFTQAVEWRYALPLDLTMTREDALVRVKGSVRNESPHTLDGVRLHIEGRELSLGTISPGETREFNELVPGSAVTIRAPGTPPPGKGVVTLTAVVNGFVTGTPLGEEKGAGMTLVYSYGTVALEGR